MSQYKVVVNGKFDAAHKLEEYPGKCRNIHGHTWMIKVCFSASKLGPLDISVDFVSVKRLVKELTEQFDHALILKKNSEQFKNVGRIMELGHNPTAERLSEYCYNYIQLNMNNEFDGIKLEWVRVYESPDAYIEYSV